jgi:hypothetical protein
MNESLLQNPPISALDLAAVTGKNDPILQELWAVKAQINADAGYTVEGILANLKVFLNTKPLPL